MGLFDRLPVSLISVDSAQVYRGLDIGAAKPDPSLLARYPHALIDIREPEQSYSAADFVSDAEQAMHAAAAGGRLPVLVGGTVLYFRALLYGLDSLPAANADVRRELAERAERLGWPALHAELARHDPLAAQRIRPSDPQRIQRALEVLALTGKPLSELQSQARLPRFRALRLVLTASDRGSLHARIERRVDQMLAAGLMEEVARLRQRPGLNPDQPAMRSVGYRQAWQALEGQIDRDALRQSIIAATRQLAKRQLTALRKFPQGLWYDRARSRTIETIFEASRRFSETGGD